MADRTDEQLRTLVALHALQRDSTNEVLHLLKTALGKAAHGNGLSASICANLLKELKRVERDHKRRWGDIASSIDIPDI